MDYTQLIERLKDADAEEVMTTPICEDAATAIEALQARCVDSYMNGFEGAKNECRDAYEELCKERDTLQAMVGASSKDYARLMESHIAALAKLAALEAQKPVAWRRPDALIASDDFRFVQIDDFTDALYLAAGAQPSTTAATVPDTGAVWRIQLEALIDIYEDGTNNPPESRCYVDGAWQQVLDESKAMLAAASTGEQG